MRTIPTLCAHASIVFAVLAGACSTEGQRQAQSRSTAKMQPAITTRVTLTPYFRGLRTVSLQINGAQYTFLVDTGGGRTLITPEVAAELGCKPRGRDVAYRMSGEPVAFQNCPSLQGELSSFSFQVAPVAVFDLGSVLPPELPKLHGLLALDSLRGQVVTLDWAKNLLILHAPADAADAVASHGLPVRLATGENGAALSVLIPVESLEDRMWFLLDSGDIKGTLVARHVLKDSSIQADANAAVQLRVGNRRPELLSVIPDDINYDGVLGTQFLDSHVVTLDLQNAP